jgi:hypothetical protein
VSLANKSSLNIEGDKTYGDKMLQFFNIHIKIAGKRDFSLLFSAFKSLLTEHQNFVTKYRKCLSKTVVSQ